MKDDDLIPASEGELSRDERAGFEALPRERAPSRILEERTVKALVDRGLIRSRRHRFALRAPWAAAAIAASLAFFVSGVVVGQWMGSRQTANALAALYSDPTDRAAALVQSTASAQRAALSDLVDAARSAQPEDVERAREVAFAALWAAAAEIARLDPDDPAAARILLELKRARLGETEREPEGVRSVVWF